MHKLGWIFLVGIFLFGYFYAVARATDAEQIPTHVEMSSFFVELNDVSPISNQMPRTVGSQDTPTYLLAKLKFMNLTDHPLQFEVTQAVISFNENEQGDVKRISVQGEGGVASGQVKIEVPVGEYVVNLRGDGLFGNDRDGQKLYLTLTLSGPQRKITLRNSGVVQTVF